MWRVIILGGINLKKNLKDIPKEYVEAYKNNDMTITEISKKTKISDHTIGKIFKQNNIIHNYKNKEALQKEYWENELSIGKIAKKFNCQTATIKKYLIELDVVNLEKESIRSKKAIYKLDKFDSITDEETAYWLGFLYADGFIDDKNNRIIINLQEKDKEHLESFANFIAPGSTVDYYESYDKRSNKYATGYRLKIYSKEICNQLKKIGMIPGKKEKYKIPNIPKCLLRHFIRGYFDGDGSISISYTKRGHIQSQFMICSCNINILKYIANEIQDILYDEKYLNIKKRDEHLSIFYITDTIYISAIMNWLYYDSTVFLKRKYEKWYDFFINSEKYKRYSLIFAEMQRVREKLPNLDENNSSSNTK